MIADYLSRSVEEAGNEIEDETLRIDRFLAKAESRKESLLTVLRHYNTDYESPLNEVRSVLASSNGTGLPI